MSYAALTAVKSKRSNKKSKKVKKQTIGVTDAVLLLDAKQSNLIQLG
jgi:hypothetical protein